MNPMIDFLFDTMLAVIRTGGYALVTAVAAELLVLLGDIPIAQYLKKVAKVPYSTLGEYVELYGYGNATETLINGKTIKVLPLAHPRQIGALGAHSEKWHHMHRAWEQKNK